VKLPVLLLVSNVMKLPAAANVNAPVLLCVTVL